MSKVVAFVPMKLNNERLPSKNTLPLAGKPMCRYILDTLTQVQGIDETYVYCSNESIHEHIPEGVRFLQRGTHLDQSSTSILEVCQSFMRDVDADIYILTHATAPFLRAESFEKAIQAMHSAEYDSALSMKKIQAFLWQGDRPLNFSPYNVPRTQDLSPVYEETCGIYMWRKEVMRDTGRRTGKQPYFIELSGTETLDVDTKEDFDFAELVMRAMNP